MIEFFLRRSAFTNLLTIILMGLGVWRFATVQREAFPDVTFDIVTINSVYPGASPEEVERLVTNPLEDALRSVDNIDHVESYTGSSRSTLVVWIDEDLSERKVERVVTDIQDAVSRVTDLPKEVERPIVDEISSDHPLISLSVVGGDAKARYAAAEELRDALEDVEGVARVEPIGMPPREIWVEADPGELRRRQLSLGEISRSIGAQNVNLTAGSVEMGAEERVIRTLGGIWNAQDVGNVILRGNDDRTFIRVADVAEVTETVEDENMHVRVNGKPAITLMVMKRGKADAIHVADRVFALKGLFAEKLASQGMEVVDTNDISYFIKRRLQVMKNNMLFGAVFIICAMLLFLDYRLAMVAAIGIPLSLATALAIGVPMGVTFNLMSIMAFIIVLGMLNDDAIVVADNIYRHLEMGKSRMQAALDGTLEVIKPVLGAILTSCFAFAPFALVSGIMGKILITFPIIVVLCLLASMAEAFFILPSHALEATRLGKPLRVSKSSWYSLVVARYRFWLGWALERRGKLMLAMAAVFFLLLGLAGWRLKIIMFPPGMIDIFLVKVEMPAGTNLNTTLKAVEKIEEATLAIGPHERDAVASWAGMSGLADDPSFRLGARFGQAIVYLKPQADRERTTDQIMDEVRDKIGELPGAQKLTLEKIQTGPPTGQDVMVRVRGKELAKVARISAEFKQALLGIEGVSDVRDSYEEGRGEFIIKPRSKDLAYAGLDLSSVSQQLLSAYFGLEATKIRRENEEVVVRVKLAKRDQDRRVINRLLVPNPRGRMVPLGQIVDIEESMGENMIAHYDYRRTLFVTAAVDNVKATSHQVNQQLMKQFADIPQRYPGYDVIYGGVEETTQKSMDSLKRAFIVAMLLNVALLMAIFESWSRPFLIILTIPIGMMGVAAALLTHGQPISFMALLGTVAMSGVVLNNAIVMVDFVNRLMAKGLGLHAALIEGAGVRVRPIVASSITTLLCLFPTAYGWGGEEPFVQPMALAMAWGLMFATPLTLFVIPLCYALQEDLKNYIHVRLARFRPANNSELPKPRRKPRRRK